MTDLAALEPYSKDRWIAPDGLRVALLPLRQEDGQLHPGNGWGIVSYAPQAVGWNRYDNHQLILMLAADICRRYGFPDAAAMIDPAIHHALDASDEADALNETLVVGEALGEN